METNNEGAAVQVIARHVDDMNIETKLYLNAKGQPSVRIRDLDAEENVSIVFYPDLTAAKAAYTKAVAG